MKKASRPIHILLQGFGCFPINFAALIAHVRTLGYNDVQWSIICTTGHHTDMFSKILGPEAVHYTQKDMNKYIGNDDLLDSLSSYHGNIYKNIESEKRFTKHKPSLRQLRSASAMYCSIKDFIQRRKPTHILFGQIEGMDGMTLLSVGKELGIPTLIPTHTRHLGETFFSPDHQETLPIFPVSEEHQQKAADLLKKFRSGETKAMALTPEMQAMPSETWHIPRPNVWARACGFVRRLIVETEMREPDVFRAMIFLNVPRLAKTIWGIRGARNRRIFDVSSINDLPRRFAFYPLQYSPESSINTPAPYFVDQLRAIDAIRFSLPSDMMLVVKEHPACMGLRPTSFLKTLRKKAGVVIARVDMPAKEIIRKADITFSVTGTAALEAYLSGRPALTLSNTFFSNWLGGPTGIDNLPERVSSALNNKIDDAEIIENVAKVYAASAPFLLVSSLDNGLSTSGHALKKSNIELFWRHLERNIRP